MAIRLTCWFALVCFLTVAPASAGIIVYDNGAPTTSTSSISLNPLFQISGAIVAGDPYWVRDTFTIANAGTQLGGVQLAIWFPTGDTASALNFSIWNLGSCSSSANTDCTGTPIDSGTSVLLTNGTVVGSAGSYTLESFMFALNPLLSYSANSYWLKIWNATVSGGGAAY